MFITENKAGDLELERYWEGLYGENLIYVTVSIKRSNCSMKTRGLE